ncbi:MAG TPA: hypothetical protein VF753_05350 [Terriglobales bacterium]
MQPMCFSARARLMVLLAVVLLVSVSALASDGRDFAGFYSVHKVTSQNGSVHLTLNVQVHNNGDIDVKNAVITLRQNAGLNLVGTTKPIELLKVHDHVTVSQQFTISKSEYETWHQGLKPQLSIVYRANGKTWEKSIQVNPKSGI